MSSSSSSFKLSALFRSAVKSANKVAASAKDASLKNVLSSIDSSASSASSTSTSSTITDTLRRLSDSPAARHSRPDRSSPKLARSKSVSSPEANAAEPFGDSSIGSPNSEDCNLKSLELVLSKPLFADMSQTKALLHKETLRERKQRWIFKNTLVRRYDRLVKMCAQVLGTEATLQVFGKLGHETGVKEYNALIAICIEKARESDDEEVALQEIHKAFTLFESMREQGFRIGEDTYGPFLMYLIDMEMEDEFHFFGRLIKDDNPSSISRFGYYEMLLYCRTNQEEKIRELFNHVACHDGEDKYDLAGNYLLALCGSDRKELLHFLQVIDIQNISSLDCLTSIFTSLGKLKLDVLAEQFLLALKDHHDRAEHVTKFIFDYVAYMPNLAVEDVISKFRSLHEKLKVKPSSTSYGSLINYCCASLKVHTALDIVEEMCDAGFSLSIEVVHSILRASDESHDFNLVHQIYSMMHRHNLSPNTDTFRSMINLSVRLRDFDSAYNMLEDAQKMNLAPTASMYNAIMGGYYREKDPHRALMVLKQMEKANVRPDCQTYSYLICNCNTEEDIKKYYMEFKRSGLPVTKYTCMALISAYAACGQFEKAKKVLEEEGVLVNGSNEMKSALVSSLASNGKICDALEMYEEFKRDGCDLEPKAVISLIEYLQSDGQLSRLLKLLEELTDRHFWLDGCYRILLYCVRFNHLSAAIDLLKQLKDRISNDEMAMEAVFDEVFFSILEETTRLQMGLDLLQVIKNDLGLAPSRKVLDALLSACVSTKDLDKSLLIWKEYQAADLPYNILSFLRMYQAVLASGDLKSARIVLSKMPRNDPHVRLIIQESQRVYAEMASEKKTEENRKTKVTKHKKSKVKR
ncbi:pentatricopeptide repeat-containing protein At4g04790, mitochondrial-like isoform X2 [Syzygium oleosum]|uniref:pentatricopeptide repeat-containing protein At4g04790, mitochondrial-like isoform X2 n=1 Tax=Syzygium oleosum TaxID=219896 RepID=UPI0024B8E394|nr:pentatricopeptide repeat-containing protein At4g04790, mitochondrial-like isoform X2 [Syzygium oleosum]